MLTEGIIAFAYNGSTFLALILLQITNLDSQLNQAKVEIKNKSLTNIIV